MTELLDHHRQLLADSAISDEVADARGYFTATTGAELGRLGFDSYQRIAPALVLPVRGVTSEIVNYQARPDRPRIDRARAREVKYETVAGSSVALDVSPTQRQHLGSTRRALWVTEGIRKGDALASAGLCAIALLGVDCFRCEDWDRVALDERRVYIAFDSDVMRKASVHNALDRLGTYLAAKGAAVHYVYLPEHDGKVGVDDYLAAGHTLDELYGLAEDELRAPPPEEGPARAPAWPTAWLLDSVERLLRRFIAFPSECEAVALALYVLHTWALDAAMVTPYVLVISPEKRSGKTRLLEALELVVREPLRTSSISEAGLFQAVERWRPTLLIDEIDRLFAARSERSEAVSGVINAGNRRGAYVIRGSQDGEPVRFGTFCPKVLAGINHNQVPDTVTDRGIVIAMQRRRVGDERVHDLFPAELSDTLEELRSRLDDWAAENLEALTAWRRGARISALDDRRQEAWDPLLAIADLAGPAWAGRATFTAAALAGAAVDAGDEAHGHILLEALRTVFERGGSPLSSKTICAALNADELLPFGGYAKGAGISARTLAKLLKPYGIKPKVVRIGGETPRGYAVGDFAETWARYVDEDTPAADPAAQAQQAQQAQHRLSHGDWDVADVADVADELQPSSNGHASADVSSNGHVAQNGDEVAMEGAQPFGGCLDPQGHRTRWRPDPLLPGVTSCAVCVPFVGDRGPA